LIEILKARRDVLKLPEPIINAQIATKELIALKRKASAEVVPRHWRVSISSVLLESQAESIAVTDTEADILLSNSKGGKHLHGSVV
jgi:hypothetical protein